LGKLESDQMEYVLLDMQVFDNKPRMLANGYILGLTTTLKYLYINHHLSIMGVHDSRRTDTLLLHAKICHNSFHSVPIYIYIYIMALGFTL
jgi:hypothetical protein